MEKLWFYAVGNDRRGPVSQTELLSLCRQGVVKPSDLVWTEGLADWQPLEKTALASLVDAPASPGAAPAPSETAAPGSAEPRPVLKVSPVDPAVLNSSPFAQAPSSMAPVPEGIVGWMKFNGIMLVIQGALACLGCIYVIIGVPMIIAGVGLMGAGSQLDQIGSVASGTVPFLQKLRTFNLAFGIYHIIMLVFIALLLLGMLFFFGAMTAAMGDVMKNLPGAHP